LSTATEKPGRVDVTLDERDQQRGLGDFLLHVAKASDPLHARAAEEYLQKSYRSSRAQLTKGERRTLGINSGTQGGFAVPRQFISRFLSIAAETALVRPRATVLPMETLTAKVPTLDVVTAQPAGSPPYFGGFVPQWIADGQDPPESDPRFRQAELTARCLAGSFECSRSLLQSSPLLMSGLLEQVIGDATAWIEDYAFLRANGVGRPLGVQASGALITTAARGGAGAITHADSLLLTKALLPSSRSRAAFVVSQAAEDELLAATTDTDSGAAASVFGRATTHLDPATGRARLFLGRNEVLVSEKLPALNTLGDFGLYDFSRYLIGDLLQMEVMTSEHVNFRENQVVYRLLHHVAGLPLLSGPVTLPDGTSQASSFVALGPA
jgi:HK97 family phage major capsid protein